MIKVTSSMPANAQPIANGFHPEAVPIGQLPPTSMVYSNPVATSELPEVNEPDKSRQEGEVKFFIGHFRNEKRTGAEMRPEIASGIVTGHVPVSYWLIFYPVLVTVPEVFAKVNLSQFLSRLFSGELGVTALLLNEYPGGGNSLLKVTGMLIGKLKLNP